MRARVGRYLLGDVIGVGSFATVHRAVDDRLESTVVVKVLAENHSLNPEIRERFIAEGRSLRRVQSPHVVTVHDIGESDRQQPFLVLDHADRGTLRQRVTALRQQGWRAGPADVLAVSRAMAAALTAVHGAGLVHRDLSPSNVLLTSVPTEPAAVEPPTSAEGTSAVVRHDERLVVADLGLCKDLAQSSGLTVGGGTAGFQPPEQRDPGRVDTRADLWALSALVMWLTDGSDPPPALLTALRRSLADDPRRRHPDARAWLVDVEAALSPDPRPAVSTGAAGAQRPAAAGSRLPRLPIMVGIAVVLLLIVGAAGVFLGRSALPPSSTTSASVAIDGPDAVAVGESATFEAAVEGVEGWVWLLPDGRSEVDSERVVLAPSSSGQARVVLVATDEDGRELRAVHDFRVAP